MPILPALATQFQCLFPATDNGQERWRWFMLTLQAILVPITASRTSNLLRAIADLVRRGDRAVALLHLHGLGEAALGAGVGGALAAPSRTR